MLLEAQRNSSSAVTEAMMRPTIRTRKAPATFSTVKALAADDAAALKA